MSKQSAAGLSTPLRTVAQPSKLLHAELEVLLAVNMKITVWDMTLLPKFRSNLMPPSSAEKF
jgi:hypothetical protein